MVVNETMVAPIKYCQDAEADHQYYGISGCLYCDDDDAKEGLD